MIQLLLIHKLEDLVGEVKSTRTDALRKTGQFIEHVSKLTVPFHIIKKYIHPQVQAFSDDMNTVFKDACDMLDYLHQKKTKSISNKTSIAKKYHKNGQYGDLKKLYNDVKGKRDLIESIEGEQEEALDECKERKEDLIENITTLKRDESLGVSFTDCNTYESTFLHKFVKKLLYSVGTLRSFCRSGRKRYEKLGDELKKMNEM